MNKETIINIANEFNCEYETGISSEINDLLGRQENVADFTLKYEENRFLLNIKLKDYDLFEIKEMFHSLVLFLEYSNSTFYCREVNDDNVEYYFLSSTEDKKAFLLNITFHS